MKRWVRFLSVAIGANLTMQFSIAAYPRFEGADQPKASYQTELEEKGTFQTCEVYSAFAVVSTDDESLEGVERIAIRPFSKSIPDSKICAKNYSGKEIVLKEQDGYPWGVIDHFLLVKHAESLGGYFKVRVYNTRTGKLGLATNIDGHQTYRVSKSRHGKVNLKYYTQINLPCVPRVQNPECWAKALKENQVPEMVQITAPNCASAFKDAPNALNNPNKIQVGVPVEVTDLAHPRVTFVSGKSTCQLSP